MSEERTYGPDYELIIRFKDLQPFDGESKIDRLLDWRGRTMSLLFDEYPELAECYLDSSGRPRSFGAVEVPPVAPQMRWFVVNDTGDVLSTIDPVQWVPFDRRAEEGFVFTTKDYVRLLSRILKVGYYGEPIK